MFYPHSIKEGYHIRKYERYQDDPSVPVPKSTKLDHNKHSATRSKTAISIPQSVDSTELKAVVPTESSASHKGETTVQETEATICDCRLMLKLWFSNGYALSKAFPSLERGTKDKDTRWSFYSKSKILLETYLESIKQFC